MSPLPFFGSDNARQAIDLPRPLGSGLALAGVGVLPLLIGLTGLIRPLSGLIFAGIFVAAGALRALLAHHELVNLRRLVDRELRLDGRPHLSPALAAWRAGELMSKGHRRRLARALARTERDLSPATLPGSSPLNRIAARPYSHLFRQLAERLAALDAPVTPRAVLQVEELLTSPGSPLYARERAGELHAALLASLDALDDGAQGSRVRVARSAGAPADRWATR